MTRTPPQHGERRCYLRGCNRPECVAANKRYCKQYRVATIHRPIRIDATPVRQRVEQWNEQGYSHTQIVAVTGGHTGDITKLLAGQLTVAPAVAHRILNSPGPTGTPFHAVTDSTGTIRRAQALHAIGHSYYKIAAAVPMAVNHLGRLLDKQPATVRVAVAKGMAVAYKRLSAIPGTDPKAKARAARLGWTSVAAWDDNIDDPNATPETGQEVVDLADRRELAALRRAEIEHLASFNIPEHEIADRLGMARAYVHDLIRDMRKERLTKPQMEAAA